MTDPVEAHCPACVGWAPSTSGPVIPCPGFDAVPTGDARDAEVRALEYAARNVVAAWKIPNVANAMAFDGLVEALRAILDADTGGRG